MLQKSQYPRYRILNNLPYLRCACRIKTVLICLPYAKKQNSKLINPRKNNKIFEMHTC